jgi:hypothetical protein
MATSPEYKPGQTFADYVAAQKAAFVPEAIAATQDSYAGDEGRTEFIPGQAASQSTFNQNPFSSKNYSEWYAAQEKEALKYLPEGWLGGAMGIGGNEAPSESNMGGGPEFPIYLPGTGPTGNWTDSTTAENMVSPNMAYRPIAKDKNGNITYELQEYGPNGLVGKPTTMRYGTNDDDVFGLLIQAGMAGVLGPLAGQLGALVAPGLGPAAQMAIGQGLVGAGKTAAMGGDLGDALKAGLTSGATSFIGSTVGDALPKGVAPTGIKSLDTALTKGLQSAAGSGVTSLLTGNKNILQDALTAGAGAAAGSGVNSFVSDAVGSTGLPPSALNILGPAAIASLTGGDGATAALKAAIGELGGAIKGSSAEGKQTGPGVAVTRDLMSGITEPGEYPQDDGSVLSVSRPEKGPNKGKLVGNVYSKEDLTRQANEEAYASWPQQITSNVDAEQAQLLSFANQAANPNLRQNVLRDIRQEDKDYIKSNLAAGFNPQTIIDAFVRQNKSPEDAARMVNAMASPTSLSTEETVPTAKFEDAEDFTILPDEFEPSSGSDKVLQDAGLVQKDAAITEQTPVEITGQTPSDFGLDFGAFAERPEATASLDAAPQKVEITGQTPDIELMRFLEANGFTADEAQKVLVSGKTQTQDAGTDYNLFNQYDPKLDNGQQAPHLVEITAKKLLEDMGLDLGAYNEGPVVAPDKLTDDITRLVEIIGQTPNTPLDYSFLETVPDKLTDDITQEVEIIGQTPPKEFPFIYPGEEPPPEVNEPVVEPIKPVVRPVVKPVIPKVPVVTPPRTTTTPSYTIPGTTTQLHQELMQLPETDILRMLNPALYAYKDAQKRKNPSGDSRMMALLNELGYRS